MRRSLGKLEVSSLRFEDRADGVHVFFVDVTDPGRVVNGDTGLLPLRLGAGSGQSGPDGRQAAVPRER